MPAAARPSPRRSGATHTPCTCAAYGVAQATSALKTSAAVVEAGERPAAVDQLGDPGAVELGAPAGLRRDADLLGVHGHAGGVQLGRGPSRGRAADQRVGLDQRAGRRSAGAAGSSGCPAGGPSAAATPCQKTSHRLLRPDDRGDRAAPGQRPARRRPRRPRRLACTGTRLAPTWQAATQRRRPRSGPTSRRRASAAPGWWCARGSRRRRSRPGPGSPGRGSRRGRRPPGGGRRGGS